MIFMVFCTKVEKNQEMTMTLLRDWGKNCIFAV